MRERGLLSPLLVRIGPIRGVSPIGLGGTTVLRLTQAICAATISNDSCADRFNQQVVVVLSVCTCIKYD